MACRVAHEWAVRLLLWVIFLQDNSKQEARLSLTEFRRIGVPLEKW